MLGRALVVLLLVLLLAPVAAVTPARAQIATDRPDFVESSATVGGGRLQIETSVGYARDGDVRTWSTPTLLRIGAGDHFELRAESDLLVHTRSDGTSGSDMGDLSLGMKVSSGRGFALLAHVDLPTAPGDGHVVPSLRAVIEGELSHGFGFGLMPGVMRMTDLVEDGPPQHQAAFLLGVVVGRSWSDRFRSFVELALEEVLFRDAGTMGSWNVGSALLLNENSQLDAALSFGATSTSTPFAATIGYSVRFGPGVTP
jgi:hypothetical protein